MRGNEAGLFDATNVEFLQGFPIPMRGNEAALWTHIRRRKGGFPIPMRGNEDMFEATSNLEQHKFPIPMRGNEESVIRRTADPAEFPIPMRGNEMARPRAG